MTNTAVNFNTTFVHVEQLKGAIMVRLQTDFNTTFVHVEHRLHLLLLLAFFHFNTTFVHVEQNSTKRSASTIKISIQHLYMWSPIIQPQKIESITFQYNICTCGAKRNGFEWEDIAKFQYNICTCGAISALIPSLTPYYFNTTFVHVEQIQ